MITKQHLKTPSKIMGGRSFFKPELSPLLAGGRSAYEELPTLPGPGSISFSSISAAPKHFLTAINLL